MPRMFELAALRLEPSSPRGIRFRGARRGSASTERVERYLVEVDRGTAASVTRPGVHDLVASTHGLFAIEQCYPERSARGAVDEQQEPWLA